MKLLKAQKTAITLQNSMLRFAYPRSLNMQEIDFFIFYQDIIEFTAKNGAIILLSKYPRGSSLSLLIAEHKGFSEKTFFKFKSVMFSFVANEPKMRL